MLDFNFFKALLTWPKFSKTSYKMISSLVQQGINPKTVIDVGGNLGQFTVASSYLFKSPTIYTFEPIPKCVKIIKRYTSKLNSHVKIFPVALGEFPGYVTFQVNSHIQASSILPLAASHQKAFPKAKEMETIEVEVGTLDQALLGTFLEHPVLLKIDTQGYEANVIQGAGETLKQVDYVLLEASFKEMFKGETLFHDLQKIMENKRFRFLRPVGWLTDPTSKEILQMDALFVNEDLFKKG